MSQILVGGKVDILEYVILLESTLTAVLITLIVCNSLARSSLLQYLFFKILNTKSVLKFPKLAVLDDFEYKVCLY